MSCIVLLWCIKMNGVKNNLDIISVSLLYEHVRIAQSAAAQQAKLPQKNDKCACYVQNTNTI